MMEWLREQTSKWEVAVEFERYKVVKNSEAQLRGLSPLMFDDEPPIPKACDANEVSPVASDDPAASPTTRVEKVRRNQSLSWSPNQP